MSTGTIYNDVNDPSLTEILVAHTDGIACYNRDQPGVILFLQLENLITLSLIQNVIKKS